MRNRFSLVSVSAFALALAACSSGDAEEEAAATQDTAVEEADALATVDGESVETTPAETAVEAAAEERAQADAPAPAPSPTASTRPAPTPSATRAVAVAQPAAFATCNVCHSTAPGQNGVGPSLAGVAGRKAGSASGFSYSAGLKGANVTWNDANLKRYLADPNSVASGTTMPAPGLNAAEINAVVTYLKSL